MQDPAVQNLVSALLANQRSRYTGGVERLIVRLSTPEGREAWEEWKTHPVTVLALDALKSLTEVVPNQFQSDSTGVALAHGAACGAGLAARLLEDPTRVFPSIFDLGHAGQSDSTSVPMESYATPPVGDVWPAEGEG